MFDDELEPRKPQKKLRDLDKMSIDELQDYIQDMKDEIARVEKEIEKKKSHAEAASAFFKK